ncbi:MAG TPA: isoprenylcysteine carboxylmethyltransferase family protein [Kofleriaceae bacterium]|nr:isoprenylcysteine carboxylmethyltransferase family protein [Kofleriaceae bacterium]
MRAALGFAGLVIVLALAAFVPAGTASWAEAWLFLGVFTASAVAVTVYVAREDPALLARRSHGGPLAEKEPTQQLIQGLASLSFLSAVVVPALDHRFGWSHVGLAFVVLGDALVVLGFLIVFVVFRENTFASSTIEVAADQRVIDSGPYAVVRHPMYAGGLVLIAGVPLALGSLVGLVTFPPFLAIIVWRLLDEERFLVAQLTGYAAYRERVRWRLVPRIW